MQDKENTKKIPLVKDNCIGCGACVAIASEVFEFDEKTGLSVVIKQDKYNEQDVNNSISACPVSAIVWTEENINTSNNSWANPRKPFVNNDCIGCGACVAIASEVFEFGSELPVTVIKLENYENKWVDDAIWACPRDAISWK